jgi:hypothetical protein
MLMGAALALLLEKCGSLQAAAAQGAAKTAELVQRVAASQTGRYFSKMLFHEEGEIIDDEADAEKEEGEEEQQGAALSAPETPAAGSLGLSAAVGSVVARLQARIAEHMHDVDAWLCLVLECVAPLDRRGGGGDRGASASTSGSSSATGEALVGEVADTACRLLARALEANPHSAPLWAVYLNVFQRRFPSKLQPMTEAALTALPGSYALWCVCRLWLWTSQRPPRLSVAYWFVSFPAGWCRRMHSWNTPR